MLAEGEVDLGQDRPRQRVALGRIELELGVVEDAAKFLETGGIYRDAHQFLVVGGFELLDPGIVEYQPVKPDVGVEHEAHDWGGKWWRKS